MNIGDEVYTLEQLRKMNCLDGDKKLVFLDKVNEYIDERERIHQISLECARKGAKKEIIDRLYPEKEIKCFAQAVRLGPSQAERREILKELELE